MPGAKLTEGEYVLVCDGAKALILENIGDAKFPNLKTLEVRSQPDAATRDLGAERPGRVHESTGSSHSSVEQTDWHDIAERDFLIGLCSEIAALVQHGKIKALTIAAPPRALGMLRAHYTQALRNVLSREVPHDYTRMPVHEIEKALTA